MLLGLQTGENLVDGREVGAKVLVGVTDRTSDDVIHLLITVRIEAAAVIHLVDPDPRRWRGEAHIIEADVLHLRRPKAVHRQDPGQGAIIGVGTHLEVPSTTYQGHMTLRKVNPRVHTAHKIQIQDTSTRLNSRRQPFNLSEVRGIIILGLVGCLSHLLHHQIIRVNGHHHLLHRSCPMARQSRPEEEYGHLSYLLYLLFYLKDNIVRELSRGNNSPSPNNLEEDGQTSHNKLDTPGVAMTVEDAEEGVQVTTTTQVEAQVSMGTVGKGEIIEVVVEVGRKNAEYLW